MKKFYLYKIINSINNKIYVGVTSNPKRRFIEHKKPGSRCTKLARAMKKYGRSNFSMQIMCVGEKEYIYDLEIKAINLYDTVNNGYNTTFGGIEHSAGYEIISRVNDKPIYVKGFWFPNLRTSAKKLNKDKGTIILWLKTEKAFNIVNTRKLKSNSLDKFCYVGGFWFPTLTKASESLGPSRSTLQKRILAGYIEQQDNKSQFKGSVHPMSNPVEIHGIIYASVMEASKLTNYSYRQIDYRLKTNKEGYKYVHEQTGN